MAYVTLAEYKTSISTLTQGQPEAWMSIENSLLQTFLDEAQSYIETKTERVFEATTATRYYTEESVPYTLPQTLFTDRDLLTVTTLTNGDGAVIPSNGYYLYPYNDAPKYSIVLKSSYSWSFATDGRVSVAGTWGYMAAASAVVKEMTKVIAWNIQQGRMRTNGVTLLDGGGIQVDEGGLPNRVTDWLKLMRRKS